MKTTSLNPSPLELKLTAALASLQAKIEARLDGFKITQIDELTAAENPMLLISLLDSDGDLHEVVVQIIQRPDLPTSVQSL